MINWQPGKYYIDNEDNYWCCIEAICKYGRSPLYNLRPIFGKNGDAFRSTGEYVREDGRIGPKEFNNHIIDGPFEYPFPERFNNG
jgi:hypothetical protein